MSARDEAALQEIFALRAKRLHTLRDRAEKWIAGLTAIVAVLGTVTLIKGPENYTDLSDKMRDNILLLIMISGAALVIGLVCCYSAAFGGMVKRSKVDKLLETPPAAEGAAAALETAVEKDTKVVRGYMRGALVATIVGTCLLASVVVMSWSSVADEPATSVCAEVGGGDKVEFNTQPDVKLGDITMVAC